MASVGGCPGTYGEPAPQDATMVASAGRAPNVASAAAAADTETLSRPQERMSKVGYHGSLPARLPRFWGDADCRGVAHESTFAFQRGWPRPRHTPCLRLQLEVIDSMRFLRFLLAAPFLFTLAG